MWPFLHGCLSFSSQKWRASRQQKTCSNTGSSKGLSNAKGTLGNTEIKLGHDSEDFTCTHRHIWIYARSIGDQQCFCSESLLNCHFSYLTERWDTENSCLHTSKRGHVYTVWVCVCSSFWVRVIRVNSATERACSVLFVTVHCSQQQTQTLHAANVCVCVCVLLYLLHTE